MSITTEDINWAIEIGRAARNQLYGFEKVEWLPMIIKYLYYKSLHSLSCTGYVSGLSCTNSTSC